MQTLAPAKNRAKIMVGFAAGTQNVIELRVKKQA